MYYRISEAYRAMKHLKMYHKVSPAEYPQSFGGFSFRRFDGSGSDISAWDEICRNGIIGENEGEEAFTRRMIEAEGYRPENVFFVLLDGKPVATATVLCPEKGVGTVHMVAALPEVRGKGVGRYLAEIFNACLYECGCERAFLLTNEFRVPAIRSYLRAGFLPVLYEEDMESRWSSWLGENGYSEVEAVGENGEFIKILCIDERD